MAGRERERLHRDNVPAAKRLRTVATKSEEVLWEFLRDRRFHGLKFRRQHPVGAFVLDFFCQEMSFAIEVDGGIHDSLEVAENDAIRQMLLEKLHIQFFRWRAADVESNPELLLSQLARELQLV